LLAPADKPFPFKVARWFVRVRDVELKINPPAARLLSD